MPRNSEPLAVGDWVIVAKAPVGRVGPWQVTEIDYDRVTVVAGSIPDPRFDAVVTVPRKGVQRISEMVGGLSVWWPLKNHQAWCHGIAIIEQGDNWLVQQDSSKDLGKIKFRNDLLERGDKSLWVKDFRTIPDPIAMLKCGMVTRLRELNVARGFRTWINEQEHASAGFSAVMSAPVRPVYHQLNVMARVLGDPTLRFLLADEVGLGKTIEAGLILKQLLIDNAVGRAVISVPRTLTSQWKRELITKLGMGKWIAAEQVVVISHEDLNDNVDADILIVDEAHRFCRGERLENRYHILPVLCQKIDRLLLISATPMRSDSFILLQLMHLIDPKNYKLSQETEFDERLKMRVKQSNALKLLNPSLNVSQRSYFVNALRSNIPNDSKVNSLMEQVETLESDSEKLGIAIKELRTEIEERFRISRRLVRNRRSSIGQDDFVLPGRSHQVIDVESGNMSDVANFVASWRERTQVCDWQEVSPVFETLLESALAGQSSVRDWINERLSTIQLKTSARSNMLFDTEKALLEQYRLQIEPNSHVHNFLTQYFEKELTHIASLNQLIEKTVVSTCSSNRAHEIYSSLHKVYGSRIATHLETQSDDENDAAIRAFSLDANVRILIVDGSAEEGLNLQVARRIINVDLPWSVNRIEQRLGRLDRFSDGRNQDAVCVILGNSSNELLVRFIDFLENATGVFSESVATAQRSLAKIMNELARRVWEDGYTAISLNFERVRESIASEHEEVMELEDIESESSFGDFPESNYRRLQAFEEGWGETHRVIDKVTSSSGGIGIHRKPIFTDSKIFKYSISKDSRIPLVQQETIRKNLSSRATFSRPLALNNPGTEMLRIGSPMISCIDEYLQREDIGRVSIGWLQDLAMSDPYVEFSLECLVTPNFDYLKRSLPSRDFTRVRRRIGAAFPPTILELRVNEKGVLISPKSDIWTADTHLVLGEGLIRLINRRGDFSDSLEHINEERLKELVQECLGNEIDSAVKLAMDDSERRINSLKTWQSGDVDSEIDLEIDISGELEFGLQNPEIKVLSIIAVVHSYEEFDE